MKKKLVLLLSGVMVFSCFIPLQAYDTSDEYEISLIDTSYTQTTTQSSITTTSNSISYGGLEEDPRFGFRDKVITTNKGTIEITTSGSIVVTGDTTYNPETGDFDTSYKNFEHVYIGGFFETAIEGGIKYGYGTQVNKDYSFIYKDKVYAISKGDIYTRWYYKDDIVSLMNIMPIFSFMEIDDNWVLFDTDVVLRGRYYVFDEIEEIVSTGNATIKLEENIEISSNNANSRTRDISQNKILPNGCLLILTEGHANYITSLGVIPKNTIINYPDGSVELISEEMNIVGENINVKIQNLNGDNSNVGFESFIINKAEIENPPVTPTPSPKPSPTPTPSIKPTPPTNNNNGSSSDGNNNSNTNSETIDTSQKLDKNKQCEYEVLSSMKLSTKHDTIELVKGDRIILPKYTDKIDKKLPINTLIIKKDGTRIVLRNKYNISKKVIFKESKEGYLAFVIYFNYKFYDFVFRLK